MRFEVMIPTRNSERWILSFLKAYRDLDVEPLYIVDGRSDDATEALLRSANARVVTFEPMGDYVEAGMIEFGSSLAQTDWVLRMDGEEFPSR